MKNVVCECRCICPPSPQLEKKILNTKRKFGKAKGYRSIKKVDMLDDTTYYKITSRPKRTRAHDHRSSAQQAPVIGNKKAVVLLIDFSDEVGTKTKSHFEKMLFSSNPNSPKSMRDYYKEVSYGKLDVTGQVVGHGNGWLRAPKSKSFYTDGNFGFNSHPKNAQKCVEDAISLAASSVDFSQFDNSGDGFIEALIVICAGTGGEQSGNTSDFWSHKWNINPVTVNGVKINRYFMAPEDGKIGVMSHELGHLLCGLPDLYDTDGNSRGTGDWDLMASGSWNGGGNKPAHPTAWCKVRCGWITPTVIHNDAQDVTISPYMDNQEIIKLPIGDINSKEYFLLSNRRKKGFDGSIPGEGLIIEHVDDTQANNTNQDRYLVDIEQADAERALNLNTNSGDASDAYPSGNNREFSDTSSPSSKNYNNENSEISVTNIKKSGSNITASISVGSTGTTAGQWTSSQKVISTFSSTDSMNTWVKLEADGWKRIGPTSSDGVTNLFSIAVQAQASGKNINAFVENNFIQRVLLNK